jgi:uncharacterized protein (DUF1684 family)
MPFDSLRSLRASTLAALIVVALTGCARDRGPEPPPVDPAEYQKEYAAWRAERQQTIASALPIVGIWQLSEGDTPYSGGAFRRRGDSVTFVPASGTPAPITFETPIRQGSIRLELTGAPDGRLWVMGTDEAHPAVKNPPAAQTYPLEPRWRVGARFDAFEKPRPVKVPDVRGGFMDFEAVGELAFHVDGREQRLTAFGFPDDPRFFVMFKDPTNESTTYQGYRILQPAKVAPGEWTVLDFNLALNPPCAFSKYTVCPTPPRENTLDVAIEAGEKRLPSADGYAPPI